MSIWSVVHLGLMLLYQLKCHQTAKHGAATACKSSIEDCRTLPAGDTGLQATVAPAVSGAYMCKSEVFVTLTGAQK